MTPSVPAYREHCSIHEDFAEDCDRCKRLNLPDRVGAPPLTPTEMGKRVKAIIQVAQEVEANYGDLYELAYGKQVSGTGGGGSGVSRPTESALVGSQQVRDRLAQLSDRIAGTRDDRRIPGAHSLMTGAQRALTKAMDASDKKHQQGFDPEVREHPVNREELLESLERKIKHLRAEDLCVKGREARHLERQVAEVRRELDRQKRRTAEAQARVEGRAMSKAQRRRARRSGSGWSGPGPSAPEQVDALRASGALPRQDQTDHYGRS